MNEHQRETAFLRQCLRYDDSPECHGLEERIASLQRDERCVRRALWLMLVLAGLLAVWLCSYGGPVSDLMAQGKTESELEPGQKELLGQSLTLVNLMLLILLTLIVLSGWDLLAIRHYSRRHMRQIQADRRAMIEGETAAEKLADLARGALRKKLDQLQAALEGRIQEHHRVMLKHLLKRRPAIVVRPPASGVDNAQPFSPIKALALLLYAAERRHRPPHHGWTRDPSPPDHATHGRAEIPPCAARHQPARLSPVQS